MKSNNIQCHLSPSSTAVMANTNSQPRQKMDVKLRPPDPTQGTGDGLVIHPHNPEPRTVDDFLRFCDVVLQHANYPSAFVNHQEQEVDRHDMQVESPLNSVGESGQGTHSSSSSISSNVEVENEPGAADFTDEDSWGQITCWCGKPFAGRPMIECESCFVWLHLTCARVRKSNIPEHFKCSRCKPKARRKRQLSATSDGDSPSTSNNGVENLANPNRNSAHGLQNHVSPTMSTPNLHTDFARSTSLKSPNYFPQTTSSNGGTPNHSPSKSTATAKRLAKPRPRRPAIVGSTNHTFENPTLLPLRLTITTSHNPPAFS